MQAAVTGELQAKSNHEAAPVADRAATCRAADDALEEGRFQDALRLYSSALKASPNWSEALVGRGLAHEMLDRTHIAIQDYQSAIRSDPLNYVAMESLASLYERSGIKLEEVPELYRRALALDPRPEWQENLRVWIAMHLTRRRPIDSYAIGLSRLAALAAKKDNPSEAEALYSRAIAKHPGMFQAYFDRGLVRLRLGEAALALGDFDTTVQLSPTFPKCLIYRGKAHEMLGRHDDAHEDFLKAVQTDSKDPEAYYYLGMSFERLGRLDQALDAYETALTLKVKPDLRGLISGRLAAVLAALAKWKAPALEERNLW